MMFSPAMEMLAALRRLVRALNFSLGVIVLLATSIGGVAAVATACYSLFSQPLPYQQPDRLVMLDIFSKRFGADMVGGRRSAAARGGCPCIGRRSLYPARQ